MRAPELKPLRIGEILDVSIKIFLNNALTLIAIVAIAVLPISLLGSLVLLGFAPDPSGFVSESELDAYVGASVVVAIIQTLAGFVASAASFKAVAGAYLGRRPQAGASVAFAAKKLHSIIWIALLSLLVIGGGAALLGIAVALIIDVVAILAIVVWVPYMLVSLYFAESALLAEDYRGTKALSRSFTLVRGRWWPTFAALVVAFLFTALVQLVLGAIFEPVVAYEPGDSVPAVITWSQALGFVATVLTVPFFAAVVAIAYFDLRVRKEGFDLELLARQIGESPPAYAEPPEREETPGANQPPPPPPPPPI